MAWVMLFFAGVLEVGWAVGLKYTEGFTRLWPSLGTVGSMAVSFWLLSMALETLPMGTAYAIWTGLGAVGTATVGMMFMDEPASLGRIVSIALIVAGILGLKLASH